MAPKATGDMTLPLRQAKISQHRGGARRDPAQASNNSASQHALLLPGDRAPRPRGGSPRARAIVLHARALSSSARARYRSPRVCALVLRARHHSPRARAIAPRSPWARYCAQRARDLSKKLFTLLDLCVSSLRRGHANLLCIVPILTDDPRRESKSF